MREGCESDGWQQASQQEGHGNSGEMCEVAGSTSSRRRRKPWERRTGAFSRRSGSRGILAAGGSGRGMALALIWLAYASHLVLPTIPSEGRRSSVLPANHQKQQQKHYPADYLVTKKPGRGPLSGRLRGGQVPLRQRSTSPVGNTVTSCSGGAGGGGGGGGGEGVALARNGSPVDFAQDSTGGKAGEFMMSRGGSGEASGGSGDGSLMSVDWSSYSTEAEMSSRYARGDYAEDVAGGSGVLKQHDHNHRSSSPLSSLEEQQQQPDRHHGVSPNMSLDASGRLMGELVRLFANRNGRMPSQDEIAQWGATFRDAAKEQAFERAEGREGPSTVHISGVLVDLASGRIGVVRKKRKVGSREEGSRMQCRHDGCLKRGSFVSKSIGRQQGTKDVWCSTHAPSGCMPEHGGKKSEPKRAFVSRQCAFLGCNLTPSFGELPTDSKRGESQASKNSEGTVMFCKQHKLPHHVNLRQPLCQHSAGCSKQAIFGDSRLRKKIMCSLHRRAGDVNLALALCQHQDGCPKRATFGFASERGKPRHCSAHKAAGEVDLVHKMCAADGCTRQAGYGEVGGQAVACRSHKLPEHISVRGTSSSSNALLKSGMVLRSAAANKALEAPKTTSECHKCGDGRAPPPPAPPTESFYFCMNTPWWSPGGPAPGWYGGDSQLGSQGFAQAEPFPGPQDAPFMAGQYLGDGGMM